MGIDVGRYLHQQVTLKRVTGKNAAAEDVYSPSTIAVRWVYDSTEVRTEDNRTITSKAQIYTLAETSPGDVVVDEDGREWPVLRVRKMLDIRGAFSHYKVSL